MRKIIAWLILFVGSLAFVVLDFNEETAEFPTKSEPSKVASVSTAAYRDSLAKLRLEHHRLRSRECERLEKLLDSSENSRELRTAAERELWNLRKNINREQEVETILETQNLGACLVNVNQNGVLVITERELNSKIVEMIGTIVVSITAFPPEQIKISTVR